jgi:hypothetical protein
MTDFLDDKKKEINSRLRELKPLVEEYNRLEAAAAALEGVGATAGGNSSRRTATRRRGPSNGRRRSASTGRRGRPRGTGKRAQQAQEIVAAKPGITIGELADAMGIQANYLYRVMPGLQKDGKVRKRGKGWHPA